MDKIIDVAAYVVERYKDMSGCPIDKMKLQKLLYFTQRESYAITGQPAFEGTFEGWKYGPVCRDVYASFCDGEIVVDTQPISDEVQYIVNNVIASYGSYEPWKLSQMSHKESSWRNARRGLRPDQNGHVVMLPDDIKKDAEKVRPYDHVWDMYYDEFEDAGVVEA